MGKFIYEGYSMEDRVTMLKNQAVKVQVDTYNRSLSDKEVDAEKDRYSRDAIELERQQDEMKRQQDEAKAGIEAVKTLMKERLARIKTGQMEVRGTLYGIADHNAGRMNFYDQYGELINSRELTPDEWQGRLFIGDTPSEGGNGSSEPAPAPSKPKAPSEDDITDVDFEEVTGDVQVDEQPNEEEQPKKKPRKSSGKKGKDSPATKADNEDDLPI